MKLNILTIITLLVASAVSVSAASFTEEEKAASFSAKEVEVLPVPLVQTQPELTEATANLSGKVYVGFIVSENGNTESSRIIKSDDVALNQTALDCVSGWQFKAAQKNGSNVAIRVIVPIRFG